MTIIDWALVYAIVILSTSFSLFILFVGAAKLEIAQRVKIEQSKGKYYGND